MCFSLEGIAKSGGFKSKNIFFLFFLHVSSMVDILGPVARVDPRIEDFGRLFIIRLFSRLGIFTRLWVSL